MSVAYPAPTRECSTAKQQFVNNFKTKVHSTHKPTTEMYPVVESSLIVVQYPRQNSLYKGRVSRSVCQPLKCPSYLHLYFWLSHKKYCHEKKICRLLKSIYMLFFVRAFNEKLAGNIIWEYDFLSRQKIRNPSSS